MSFPPASTALWIRSRIVAESFGVEDEQGHNRKHAIINVTGESEPPRNAFRTTTAGSVRLGSELWTNHESICGLGISYVGCHRERISGEHRRESRLRRQVNSKPGRTVKAKAADSEARVAICERGLSDRGCSRLDYERVGHRARGRPGVRVLG